MRDTVISESSQSPPALLGSSESRLTRLILLLALCSAFGSVPLRSYAQAAGEPATTDRPRTYLLVAAIGDRFEVVSEVPSTGTHLSPYRRESDIVPNDVLNKFALNGLDAAVAKIDPNSRRVYASLKLSQLDDVAPAEREAAAIRAISASLTADPQRTGWHRILVALPAYRSLAADGMASKLRGFGIFMQPLCQAGCAALGKGDHLRLIDAEPTDGVELLTSDNETIRARTFLAPFSYIAVWTLDPKTLTVIDREQQLGNQKLAEPVYKPMDPSNVQQYVASRLAGVIEASIGETVTRSEAKKRRGTVEVGEVRDVTSENPVP